MANMIVLVLNEPEKLFDIVQAWEQIGIPGVTILDSVASRHLRALAGRDDLPLIPPMRAVFAGFEERNRPLFTVIEDDAILESPIQAAQNVVGDFMEPHTGILFGVPVSPTCGVPRRPVQTPTYSPAITP